MAARRSLRPSVRKMRSKKCNGTAPSAHGSRSGPAEAGLGRASVAGGQGGMSMGSRPSGVFGISLCTKATSHSGPVVSLNDRSPDRNYARRRSCSNDVIDEVRVSSCPLAQPLRGNAAQLQQVGPARGACDAIRACCDYKCRRSCVLISCQGVADLFLNATTHS